MSSYIEYHSELQHWSQIGNDEGFEGFEGFEDEGIAIGNGKLGE